jgi:nucleoside 2-deoxyribosyltransferase
LLTIHPYRRHRRVYCAGPLFNDAERREMERIGAALATAGYEPFVPHADSLEFSQVQPWLIGQGFDAVRAGQILHQAIFALDVYQVMVDCGSLVLNINGRVPDEGAVAEASIAWTLGKPIVIFKADARSKIAGRDNPLIVGQTGFQTVDDIDRLGECLSARQAELALDPDWQVPCPPHLERTLREGERLWSRIVEYGGDCPIAELAAIVLELFDDSSSQREQPAMQG